jgi:hypothetical protein
VLTRPHPLADRPVAGVVANGGHHAGLRAVARTVPSNTAIERIA